MGAFDKFIAASARRHGVSEEYLRKLIQYESKGDPNAVSPTGVRGVAQITGATGKSLGLNKRNFTDPAAQIDAAAQLAKNNRNQLTKALGRPPTDDELYLGHLQGAGGASSAFKNPTARAIDVLDPKHVKVNLPASQRGRLNTITAKEYQDIHRSNFNRAGKPTGTGTIDIGDQPSLKTLNPPTTTPKGDRLKPTIPLSQLAPTEASNTMARYPNYDQAVEDAINQVNQGGRGIQVAGLVLPSIRGPGGKMRKNPMKPPSDPNRALPPPSAVPGARTPTTAEEAANAQRAYERQQGLKTKADRVRRGDPATIQGPQQQGAPIAGGSSQITTPAQPGSTAPINPRSVPTQRITRDQATGAATVGGAAAVGAAAGDAASRVDPAVAAVQQQIQGRPDPNLAAQSDPASQAAIAARISGRKGPIAPTSPAAAGANPMSPENPDVTRQILSQAMPVIQDAMKEPQVASAAKVVAGGMARAAAKRQAMQADMQNDPTYYQMQAARKAGGSGGADPLNERAMAMAVNQDYQRPRSSPRSMPAGPQQASRPLPPKIAAAVAKDQSRVQPQELGDNRQLPPEVAQQFPVEDPTKAGLSPAVRGLPSVQSAQPQMGVAGAPGSPPMNDPSMMALMQFFMQQQQPPQPDPMGMSIPMGAP
jgi:hypothetical protein